MTIPSLTWKEETLEENFNQLSGYAIQYAEESREYYKKNSGYKRSWAKGLRLTAIFATALGGLLPVLSQIMDKYNINLEPAWATVAITIAVTAIGLDRFFGFSSAWMRFVTTEIKINAKIEQFKLNIENEKFSLAGKAQTFLTAKTTLNLIVTFINEISEIVKDETNTWMIEFQNVIQKLNDDANVKAAASNLGGLTVVVDNSEKFPEGLRAQLESNEPVNFNGSSYSFGNLYPKIYQLKISGKIEEQNEGQPVKRDVSSSILINVTPGNITTQNVTLK